MCMQNRIFCKAMLAALLAFLSVSASGSVYFFSINTWSAYGDPSRSFAFYWPSPSGGTIDVFVPLDLIRYPDGTTHQDYFEHYAPATGVMPSVPSRANVLQLGTEPPRCQPGPPGCVSVLPSPEMYGMSLTTDVWGHFEGTTWIPNPMPAATSFCAPDFWGTPFTPPDHDCFRMYAVTAEAEPGTLMLFVFGLLAIAGIAHRAIPARSAC